MPRPIPPPEDEKERITVFLSRKVAELADAYRALHPEEDLRDFSAVVSRAIIDYAHSRHPGLLAECIRAIRASGTPARAIAETQAPYGAGLIPISSEVEKVIQPRTAEPRPGDSRSTRNKKGRDSKPGAGRKVPKNGRADRHRGSTP